MYTFQSSMLAVQNVDVIVGYNSSTSNPINSLNFVFITSSMCEIHSSQSQAFELDKVSEVVCKMCFLGNVWNMTMTGGSPFAPVEIQTPQQHTLSTPPPKQRQYDFTATAAMLKSEKGV
ncbi:hypothetical protein DICA3_D06216 [Diutina catenulata]